MKTTGTYTLTRPVSFGVPSITTLFMQRCPQYPLEEKTSKENRH